jgi:hypothetical protein
MSGKGYLLIALLILFSGSASAQTEQTSKSAYKYLDLKEDPYESTIASLDAYAIELQKNLNSKGYIVVYRGLRDLPGVATRYAIRTKNYLNTRLSAPREIFELDGGIKQCLTIELWVAPEGSSSPNLNRESFQNQKSNNFLQKFDEAVYYLENDPGDCGWCDYQNASSLLDGFALALKNAPQSRGYIIVYNQGSTTLPYNGGKVTRDPSYIASRILKELRNHLINRHHIPSRRLITIEGGYRESRIVELWISPLRTPAPKPIPTIFP